MGVAPDKIPFFLAPRLTGSIAGGPEIWMATIGKLFQRSIFELSDLNPKGKQQRPAFRELTSSLRLQPVGLRFLVLFCLRDRKEDACPGNRPEGWSWARQAVFACARVPENPLPGYPAK